MLRHRSASGVTVAASLVAPAAPAAAAARSLALSGVTAVLVAPPAPLVGALVFTLVVTLAGLLVGALVVTLVVTLVGALAGLLVGALVGTAALLAAIPALAALLVPWLLRGPGGLGPRPTATATTATTATTAAVRSFALSRVLAVFVTTAATLLIPATLRLLAAPAATGISPCIAAAVPLAATTPGPCLR